MRKHIIIQIVFLCSMFCPASFASVEDDIRSMKEQLSAMQTKVDALEQKVGRQTEQIRQYETSKRGYEERIASLEDQLAQRTPAASAADVPKRSAPAKWTPEIGAVADIVANASSSKEDGEGRNRISARELELVLGSAIDPFSRLDATISFSDSEDPSLEEVYMTRLGLPLGMTARLGKFKPKVGKVLGTHRDGLDTVDEPLVIQRYFGVEGMSKSGLDLTTTLNTSWPVTQQVTLGILEGGTGEDGTAFGTASRAPTLYGHLKNYMDLTDTTGLEIGFSPMFGSGGDDPGFDAQVLAGDVTLTQSIGAAQTVRWQSEVFNLNRRKTEGIDLDSDGFADVKVDGKLWGAYSVLDYRFLPRWAAGFRYDYAQLVDNDPTVNPHNNDNGQSAYLTFLETEFARWRLQYSHTNLATGKDDNAVYLQGTFVIGDHKHKLQ